MIGWLAVVAVMRGASRSAAGTSARRRGSRRRRGARRRSGWPRAGPWSSGTARTGRPGRRSRLKLRESVAAIITYGAGTASGKTSRDRRPRSARTPRPASAVEYGESGLGSLASITSISTLSSPITLRTWSSTARTVSPTMIRMLTPAVAVWAITLSAGLPGQRGDRERRPGHRRASPGPGAVSARGRAPGRAGRRSPSAAAAASGACGASRRNSSTVGAGTLAGIGERSSRVIARASRAVGPSLAGRRGVAAAALDAQLDRDDALLGHADDADRLADAGERVVRDRAALVDHEPRPDAAAAGAPRRPARPPYRTPPRRSRTTARRPGPGVKSRSSRVSTASQIRDQAALVVEGAAAPDLAVDDRAAERAVLPVALDRDDVEVGHQHDRPLGARARASGTAGRGCGSGSARAARAAAGTAGRAPRRTRRTPRCRPARARGRRRSGSGPAPAASAPRAAAPAPPSRHGGTG